MRRALVTAALVLSVLSALVSSVMAQGVPHFINQWGTQGAGAGQFVSPSGLALGSDGTVYVADQYNYRVQQFSSTGEFIRAWGSFGSGPGQFVLPLGITCDAAGNVFVADVRGDQVEVFSPSGVLLRGFSTTNLGARDVAIGSNGETYVVGDNTHSVRVYAATGAFEREIGIPFMALPSSAAFAPDGSLLVGDSGVGGVWRVDPSTGANLGFWRMYSIVSSDFTYISAVSVGSDGSVYVCDYRSGRIAILSPAGSLLGVFGGLGNGPGQLASASDVVVAPTGDVFVVDLLGNKVVHYAFGATAVRTVSWGSVKSGYR